MVSFGPNGAIYGDAVTLAASAARTTSGSGSPFPMEGHTALRLLLDVTAASGTTPSLTVTVETSGDGSTGWRSAGAFAAKTAVSQERLSLGNLDRFVRVSWTITGTTPSLTFSVSGEAL